jgi:ATP-binding cassette subfamily B protein
VEIMKGAAQEGAETETFVTNARRVRNAFVQQGDIEARFIPNLMMGLVYAGGLFHALLLFRAGVINTGDVVAYFGLLRMLEFPTFASAAAYTQMSLGVSGARRILDLINRETNLDQNASGRTSTMRGEIEFRNVSFAYPDGGSVLQNISFHVKPGQTVAIRWTNRRGQNIAGQTDQSHLRCKAGTSIGGWCGCPRLESGFLALANLHDRAGHLFIFTFHRR